MTRSCSVESPGRMGMWTSQVEEDFVIILEAESRSDATRVGEGLSLSRFSSLCTDDATIRVVEGVGDMGTSAVNTKLVGRHL